MRLKFAFLLLLLATPVCAQTSNASSSVNALTSSRAAALVNIATPANTTSTTNSTSRLITPPTVIAPGLAAAGIETCLGSNSGGLSVMGGGFSFGRTEVDDGCTIRLLARQLFAFGFKKAAMAVMCQDWRVALAMDMVGTPCPGTYFDPRETGLAYPVKAYTSDERRWFGWQAR
jgi:hypothetical protein